MRKSVCGVPVYLCKAHARAHARHTSMLVQRRTHACAACKRVPAAQMRVRRASMSVRVRRARACECNAHDVWHIGGLAHTFASACA
eukprot:1375281-Pleurochrysis_carterae.AAC.1